MVGLRSLHRSSKEGPRISDVIRPLSGSRKQGKDRERMGIGGLSTIFPQDSEIREYAAYEVRTRKIILEEFKHEYGREPNELEIPELLRAAIIPIGFLPKQNGQQKSIQDQPQNNSNSARNEAKPRPQEQPRNQPSQQQKAVDPKAGWNSEVLKLLNEFPENLRRKSQSKIAIVKEIPRSEWNDVKKGFEKEGWKYDWKEKAFMISEEMRA